MFVGKATWVGSGLIHKHLATGKGLTGTNVLAYYVNSLIKAVKSFTGLAPGASVMTFYGRNYFRIVVS
jgi:hypothetical protein